MVVRVSLAKGIASSFFFKKRGVKLVAGNGFEKIIILHIASVLELYIGHKPDPCFNDFYSFEEVILGIFLIGFTE